MLAFVIFFDILGSTQVTSADVSLEPVWTRRCQMFQCCNNIDDDVYKDVAKILSKVLGDADLVLSDILVGLIILNRQDSGWETNINSRVHSRESLNIESQNDKLNQSTINRPDWMKLEIAGEYFKYAIAIYSWPLYISMNWFSGTCNICCTCRCFCSQPNSENIEGDNCCHSHITALKKLSGLTDQDILYVSCTNNPYELPFYVALDHKLRSIVIAIRGTISLVDILTDISAEPASVQIDDRTLMAHAGMAKAASIIVEKLTNLELLAGAMRSYPDYSLVLTGHSLGAGTAAVAALLLRSKYPTLRCFCYSPPSVFMNEESAQYSEVNIMSITVGRDWAARTTFRSIEVLKKRIITALHASVVPKYKVLARQCFCNDQIDMFANLNEDQELDLESESHYSTFENVPEYPDMLLPGHILHLTYSGPKDNLTVLANWSSRNMFKQYIISPSMLLDHLPHTLYRIFKRLHSDPMFGSDSLPVSVDFNI